jgi:hypothetical protein
MRFSSGLRAAALALTLLAGLFASGGARADEGTISIRIFKAGVVIGGSAGLKLRLHLRRVGDPFPWPGL